MVILKDTFLNVVAVDVVISSGREGLSMVVTAAAVVISSK